MIAAIIQARMGSTRLPGKIMMEIEGKSLLARVVERVKCSNKIDRIIIATTNMPSDRKVSEFAKKESIACYEGSENDVLDRYYRASMEFKPEVIVRITADCPLIDPEIIGNTIDFFYSGNFDYVSTGRIVSTFPDGLDTEVFKFRALKKAWKAAKLTSEREHVTPYIWKNEDMFKIGELKNNLDLSYMRWTVDEPSDLDFVKQIYKSLHKEGEVFHMRDILGLLEKTPGLLKINGNILRNSGYMKSINEDN